MFKFQLAYRHANGEVEGFVGLGFSESTARRKAEDAARQKVSSIRESFNFNRLIFSESGLSGDEIEIVKKDWALES